MSCKKSRWAAAIILFPKVSQIIGPSGRPTYSSCLSRLLEIYAGRHHSRIGCVLWGGCPSTIASSSQMLNLQTLSCSTDHHSFQQESTTTYYAIITPATVGTPQLYSHSVCILYHWRWLRCWNDEGQYNLVETEQPAPSSTMLRLFTVRGSWWANHRSISLSLFCPPPTSISPTTMHQLRPHLALLLGQLDKS